LKYTTLFPFIRFFADSRLSSCDIGAMVVRCKVEGESEVEMKTMANAVVRLGIAIPKSNRVAPDQPAIRDNYFQRFCDSLRVEINRRFDPWRTENETIG
jgi:hypothetical protein